MHQFSFTTSSNPVKTNGKPALGVFTHDTKPGRNLGVKQSVAFSSKVPREERFTWQTQVCHN